MGPDKAKSVGMHGAGGQALLWMWLDWEMCPRWALMPVDLQPLAPVRLQATYGKLLEIPKGGRVNMGSLK